MGNGIESILGSFNPDIITWIVGAGMILLDILIIGIGIAYLGFGLLFGTRKSLRRALSFLIPFTIFICVIDLITKLIVNADISFIVNLIDPELANGATSLKDLGANLLAEYLYNGNIDAASSSKVLGLCESIVVMVLRLVIYLFGLASIALSVAPLLRFITWITYKIQMKGKPKEKKTWASRIGGMGIASFRYILALIIVVIPLFGFISTTDMLLQDAIAIIDTIDEEEQKTAGELDLVTEILENVEKGMNISLTKSLLDATKTNDGASLDMKMLGQNVQISTEDGTFNILEEYGNIHRLVPTAMKAYDVATKGEEINYGVLINSFDANDVSAVKDVLKESGLVEVALPVGYDYLCYYMVSENLIEEYGLTEEDLKKIEVNKDFDLIVDASSIVLDVLVTEKIEFTKTTDLIETLVTNDKISSELQTFIGDIVDTSIVSTIGLPYAEQAICSMIDESGQESLQGLKEIVTAENLDSYLRNDIVSVFEIASDIYGTELKNVINAAINGQINEEVEIDFSDPAILEVVQSTIVKVMDLEMVQGNENTLIKAVVGTIVTDDSINIDEILFDENGESRIDWTQEPEVLANVVVKTFETFGQDFFINFDTPEQFLLILLDQKRASEIVTEITKSDVAKTLVVTLLYDAIQKDEGIPQAFKDVLTKEALLKCFQEDITTLVHCIEIVYETQLGQILDSALAGEDIDFTKIDFKDQATKEALETTIKDILTLTIIQGNEEALLEYAISLLNENSDFVIDPNEILYDANGNKYINWESEVDNVARILGTLYYEFGDQFLGSEESDVASILTLVFTNKGGRNILELAKDTQIVRNIINVFVRMGIESTEDIPEELLGLLTKETIDEMLEDDLIKVFDVISSLFQDEELIAQFQEVGPLALIYVDLSTPERTKLIKDLIDCIFELSIIQGNEELIIESIFAFTPAGEYLDIKSVLYDQDGNKYIDWNVEKNHLENALIGLAKILKGSLIEEQEFEVYLDLFITNEETDKVLDELLSSVIAKKLFVYFLSEELLAGDDIPEELKAILTTEKLNDCFETDIKTFYLILKDVYNSELKDDILSLFKEEGNFNPDFTDEAIQSTFKDVITRIVNLSIIKGEEEYIIKFIMSNIEGIEIDLDEILYDEEGNKYLDWENEITTLCDALIIVINTFGADFSNITFEQLQEKLLHSENLINEFVDVVAESEIIRAIILDILPDIINEEADLPEEFASFFSEEKFALLEDKETYKTEIKLLLNIVSELLELGIADFETFEITTENSAELKATLSKLLDSIFVKNDEKTLFKLFMDTTNFTSILEESEIVLDYDNVTDWKEEINISIDIAISFMDIATTSDFVLSDLFKGNMTKEEIEEVSTLFAYVEKSQLFKPIVYQLIDNVGYDITLTDQDKALIEENGFDKEIENLLNVLGTAQELLEAEDLTTLKGEDVEKVMLDASNMILSSKVVGTILENALGENGLDILPVDEFGNLEYDLTNPTTLKEKASDIKELINLANNK